jgi:flagellar hook-associated protein 1 FlgK
MNVSSLYTAISGMNAQRRVLDVTAHNVANASTPGYHRQRVDLVSMGRQPVTGLFSGRSEVYGVDVAGVHRSVDELLQARAIREDANRAMADLTSSQMAKLEGIFPEPTDVGLANQLQEFWSSWNDLANDPASLANRTQVLENATNLVSALRRNDAQLNSLSSDAAARLDVLVGDVNSLATQIATLNATINANPGASNDLLDQRDLLVADLARLTGAVSRPTTNGQVDVYVGGRAIVSGVITQPVGVIAGQMVWQSDNVVAGPPSGEGAALSAMITDVVPRYATLLDGIANELVTAVNTLHTAGYDQSSTTGRNFFDPAGTTAGTIALSVDVAGLPANIAAGAPVLPGPVAPGLLDGEQARLIAGLADAANGANTRYRAMITGLAVETRTADQRARVQDQVAEAAIRDEASVGSVSIDEEMANLVVAQRAFEASARVLTAVDEMLATLIERTGVVGR